MRHINTRPYVPKVLSKGQLRYCDHCSDTKPREGGRYVALSKLRQTWACKTCAPKVEGRVA